MKIELGEICNILLVVFIVLKLCSVITWSWWWVLSPMLILIVVMIISALIIGLCEIYIE